MANQTGQPRDRHCECANAVREKYGAIAFFVFHLFPKNIKKKLSSVANQTGGPRDRHCANIV